ncbi:hypothetical protein [Pseudomonas sp. GZD-209]|uniref:hypothetical protein n=1 Tax=Pseudomonas sp. GZD-209 TaxID=3404807 RepID=UPI003BB6EFA6
MPGTQDIRWFKEQFQQDMAQAIIGTPLTVDHLTALACQETGSIWPFLRKAKLPLEQVTALCVGDTLDDTAGRKAFPRNKAELLLRPRGDLMFAMGHQALVDMARFVPGYQDVAKKPNKFCHGYGVFQLDLQFFKPEPDFFLDRHWATFSGSLGRAMDELKGALRQLGFEQRRQPLSDLEFAQVGIVYNTGGFVPSKGLRQGHKSDDRFYGENLFDFIRLCHTVATEPAQPALPTPAPGQAIVAAPSPLSGKGTAMQVDTREGMLRVRSQPFISTPAQANVVANLPDGHAVRVLSKTAENGFVSIETSLSGARVRGFCAKRFLVPATDDAVIEITQPAPQPSTVQGQSTLLASMPGDSAIPAVFMPRKNGVITRRANPADAHSLNEAGQPTRQGNSAGELREALAAIIQWLAVDNTAHLRYQPHDGLTFCNIYAHDYCLLAGAYLPRCWWSTPALLKLAAGQQVTPLIGDTLREMRANDLFRWLREFGPGFGWRQTGTLTTLQAEANQGAIGLIVARRKEDGRSGHIVMVVPETAEQTARRDTAGNVIAPLQSQAGARNFQYGRGAANWWNGEQFAEFAFWLHA